MQIVLFASVFTSADANEAKQYALFVLVTVQDEEKTQDDIEAEQFEINVIKPTSPAETLNAAQTSPLPAVPPPSLQITPASQPGSQEEQIEALQGLEDPPALQEQKAEEFEDSEKTPEQSYDDDTKLSALLTPGSESSSKKKGKRMISKKRRKNTSAAGEEAEVDPAIPPPPSSPTRQRWLQKLIIKPGKSSKGSGKKE